MILMLAHEYSFKGSFAKPCKEFSPLYCLAKTSFATVIVTEVDESSTNGPHVPDNAAQLTDEWFFLKKAWNLQTRNLFIKVYDMTDHVTDHGEVSRQCELIRNGISASIIQGIPLLCIC